MNKALANWKTTVAGVIAVLTAVVSFAEGGSITMEQVGLLMGGLGLAAAKDGTTGSAP